MSDEITIVTAFYKLNLHKQSVDSYKASRTSRTYLDFFSFNVRLKNKMIIYIDDTADSLIDIEKEIYALRAKEGLESKTLVIKKSLQSFAESDFDAIATCFREYNQSEGRFDSIHPPHNSPEYDYLMYAKSFFVLDSMQNEKSRDFVSDNILWLDFGFNLGGRAFLESSDFDFMLAPQKEIEINMEVANTLNIDKNLLSLQRGGGVRF